MVSAQFFEPHIPSESHVFLEISSLSPPELSLPKMPIVSPYQALLAVASAEPSPSLTKLSLIIVMVVVLSNTEQRQ